MAYFNHAFKKIFLGTGATRAAGVAGPTNPHSTGGFVTTANVPSVELSKLTPGYFGFFDPNTWLSAGTVAPSNCCPLVLASSALLTKDKLNNYIGGYRETNKSKIINPKYLNKFYKVETCVPQQSIISVGTTPETLVPGLPATGFQGGTVQANCAMDFLCGETYYLRIDLKGSPVLRFLNHNAYQTLSAYTGCCSGPVPDAVDPTLVYIEWAKALVINQYLTSLVLPVVFDTTGAPWYAPGTTVDPISGAAVLPAQWWDAYVSPAGPYAGLTAGMRLFGAYVETKFGNCSFQITDFFEKEPVRLYASLVDYNGDPCVFEGLCVYNDCLGIQGMGFGEQVVRDLILSESYLQNFFSTDIRIREITQGNDILGAVNRNALYTRYFILHVVPRFNNPSSTFDNDQYMLEIIVNEANPLVPVGNVALETFVNSWLTNCPNCVTMETDSCTRCTPEPNA